jgi:DNA-binding beta-propeller fold protein YncE
MHLETAMNPVIRRALQIASLAAASTCIAAPSEPFYRLAAEAKFPSAAAPEWDYLAYDDARSVLYMARRDDGILAYDTKTRKALGTLRGTAGGNAIVLIHDLDRGYVVHEDGSLTPFKLSTRQTSAKLKVGESADNGVYDASSGQVIVTMGDNHQIAFVDAKSGEVKHRLDVDSERIEAVAPDGHGKAFVALRDRNKILRVDTVAAKMEAEFPTAPACEQPNGMAYDAANKRVLVGCRGAKPVLAALDADTGRVVSTIAIGRGNDNVVFDPDQHRIYTSNGVDANLVVIQQDSADHYRMLEAVTTRPNARTMALDPRTKDVYLVTAEGAVDPSKKVNKGAGPFYPNTYFKDTFTLLTLSRR